MSDSKKISSPYAVLDNRPIDQWKVVELKEELRRRKLMTTGLKEVLVKRLDEAIRAEVEDIERNIDNGFDSVDQPEFQSNELTPLTPASERTDDIMDLDDGKNQNLDNDNDDSMTSKLDSENCDNGIPKMDTDWVQVDDGMGSLPKETAIEEIIGGTDPTGVEGLQEVQSISVGTSVVASESMVSVIAESGNESQTVETLNKDEETNLQQEDVEPKPSDEEAKPNSSDLTNQVVEVSQVKSDSISIDTISITEKNELKDNVIADDVKLELDVEPEMVQQPSFNNVVLDAGKSESLDAGEPLEDKVTAEEKDVNNAENTDIGKKNDSGDVGSSEKLNLERSSGDDSMEEDALDSKQIDSKFSSDEVADKSEKIEVPVVKEDGATDAMVEDIPTEKTIVGIENKSDLAVAPVKRKLHEQEAAGNSETVKRQHRWNPEGLKVPEPQSSNRSASNTPKDSFQPAVKRNFSRSDSTVSEEVPKERIVPPSSKPPTTSLRIDRFLRPFTLKAVQELLGKTGTVVSFWMDHIKTHCYVTYSSVEEAVETRNAVYNLQWPTNGGHLLVAEFVEPQEVTLRVEAPLQAPATPVATTPTLPTPPPPPATMLPPQPSPRVQVQRQQLPPPPPLPLPPPPPLSNPPPARERALPPPPPLAEKVDPPIVTLDDLFRKTRATPRIYYLPLSDEQVAAKLKAQGKIAKQ